MLMIDVDVDDDDDDDEEEEEDNDDSLSSFLRQCSPPCSKRWSHSAALYGLVYRIVTNQVVFTSKWLIYSKLQKDGIFENTHLCHLSAKTDSLII